MPSRSPPAQSTSDEHVLIALVYEDRRAGGSTLVEHGIDPDGVFDALVRFGVAVPPLRPPAVPPPAGPPGSVVYVHQCDASAVSRALRAQHPPGTLVWGTNVSKYKPDHVYFIAERDIDLAPIARSAVANHGDVEEVAADQAHAAERDGAPAPD